MTTSRSKWDWDVGDLQIDGPGGLLRQEHHPTLSDFCGSPLMHQISSVSSIAREVVVLHGGRMELFLLLMAGLLSVPIRMERF